MDPREEIDHENGGNDAIPDLRYYWAVIKKRRWIIIGTTIVVTALALAITMRRPKIYQATATLIVDPQAPKVMGRTSVEVVELGSGGMWLNTDYYNTQQQILKSRSLARQTVVKHQLHRDARLIPNPLPSATEEQLIEDAAGLLQHGVRVALNKESRVFAISVRHTDAQLATDLTNHVSEAYIEQNLAVKHNVTRSAKGWVAKQLDDVRKDLDASEGALIAFKESNNMLSVSLEDRQNMLSLSLSSFSGAVTETQKKRFDLEARRRALELLVKVGDGAHAPSPYVSEGSETIAQLRDHYLQERRELTGLVERYGPKHPEVVARQSRVASARKDLESEVSGLLQSISAEITALKDLEHRYSAEVKKLTQEAFELNKREQEFKRLTREADSNEANFKLLLTRLSESGLQEQDHANNIRLLDSARKPRLPIEPNLRNSGLVGLALGLVLAFALASIVEFLDRTVKSQEDIEAGLGLPFLGMVPSVDEPVGKEIAELYIARNPTSTVAECCRVVRTNILFCSPDRPLKTLVVTSSNPVEGKTMTVVNLGITMAQNGHRTLIIDTDMRRPRLHKALRASNENGISRLIVGETTIEAAVKSTDVPNMYLMPCGPLPPNPAELLQTEKFAVLIKSLEERYDRVIFDSPPVLAVTDAVVLSRVVDGTVLVVRAAQTTRDAVARAKRSIGAVKGNIVGVVLNDVNLKNPHYSYYYQYYQYRYHEAPAAADAGDSNRT